MASVTRKWFKTTLNIFDTVKLLIKIN